MINYLLFITLCIYNALDVWQTNMLFGCCDAYEANPVLRFFMRYDHDIQTIIIIKCTVLAIVGIGLVMRRHRQKKDLKNDSI